MELQTQHAAFVDLKFKLLLMKKSSLNENTRPDVNHPTRFTYNYLTRLTLNYKYLYHKMAFPKYIAIKQSITWSKCRISNII